MPRQVLARGEDLHSDVVPRPGGSLHVALQRRPLDAREMNAPVRLSEPASPVEQVTRAEDQVAPAGPLLSPPVDCDLGIRLCADEVSERDVALRRPGSGEADEQARLVSRSVEVALCRQTGRRNGTNPVEERPSLMTDP